ncbi:hypothetical protein F6X68_14420 [Micromonospora sp. AMSO12t]|uniref:hypothetical protein n=1 Tax=Micromonospora sp. AMSO12t TaxID=2650410 RepID=UPI00124B2940|nr:hypothetical protein [Micromonospora sp. AMSO12t]KAB1153326.1 hypothetical protein F6X68_14420 [Micromonospora sp. AMSO12t]
MSPVTNDALLEIRRSSTYRAGIWLARTANLALLPVVVWGIASGAPNVPALPDSVFMAAWAVGCVTLVPAVVLFYRSGIPFEHKGATWVTDARVGNAILRDVFWRRP